MTEWKEWQEYSKYFPEFKKTRPQVGAVPKKGILLQGGEGSAQFSAALPSDRRHHIQQPELGDGKNYAVQIVNPHDRISHNNILFLQKDTSGLTRRDFLKSLPPQGK